MAIIIVIRGTSSHILNEVFFYGSAMVIGFVFDYTFTVDRTIK
jgi:hypothetical protein